MEFARESRTIRGALSFAVAVGALALIGPASALDWDWAATGSMNFYTMDGLYDARQTPEGEPETGFQIEHLHFTAVADLTDEFSMLTSWDFLHWEISSVIYVYGEYYMHDLANVQVGRIVIPFGRFNYLSYPNNYLPVTRPILYPSHDVDFMDRGPNFPRPFFMTTWTDLGACLYGSWWPTDDQQLWYAAYVVNGPQGADDLNWLQIQRYWKDNNDGKHFGGRVSYSLGDDLSVGASGIAGRYDDWDALQHWMIGADLRLGWRDVGFWGEYIFEHVRVRDAEDEEARYDQAGFTAQVDAPLFGLLEDRLKAFATFGRMWRTGPLLVDRDGDPFSKQANRLDPFFTDDVSTMVGKYSLGLAFTPVEFVTIKAEYAWWDFDTGLSGFDVEDAARFSLGAVASF